MKGSIMTEVVALKPHISLNVRNVERSIAFYRSMLGIEPLKVRTGYAKFDVQNPPLNLALNEVPSLKEPGALSHLGIQVRWMPLGNSVFQWRYILRIHAPSSSQLTPSTSVGTSCRRIPIGPSTVLIFPRIAISRRLAAE